MQNTTFLEPSTPELKNLILHINPEGQMAVTRNITEKQNSPQDLMNKS